MIRNKTPAQEALQFFRDEILPWLIGIFVFCTVIALSILLIGVSVAVVTWIFQKGFQLH